jgi:hypothetical protein
MHARMLAAHLRDAPCKNKSRQREATAVEGAWHVLSFGVMHTYRRDPPYRTPVWVYPSAQAHGPRPPLRDIVLSGRCVWITCARRRLQPTKRAIFASASSPAVADRRLCPVCNRGIWAGVSFRSRRLVRGGGHEWHLNDGYGFPRLGLQRASAARAPPPVILAKPESKVARAPQPPPAHSPPSTAISRHPP